MKQSKHMRSATRLHGCQNDERESKRSYFFDQQLTENLLLIFRKTENRNKFQNSKLNKS